ncbi:AI-2E family transporter [Ruania alba]|uniref:Predicted PurR-regulated permease PerM n=1 Tax=Ruania alba TaxID=648782 RepID=A0A1H5KF90_9MICO|nr:AI-2E family transporter [Ruania alba]SEE63449.1 Predicted PurR-regulated permease PerM [Ruania alba]
MTETPAPVSRPSLASAAVVLAGLTVAAVGLHFAASIVAPAFFAFTLVVSARPLQRMLVRWRVPRMLAAILVLLSLYVLLTVLLLATVSSLTQAAFELPKYAADMRQIYLDGVQWLETLGVDNAALVQLAGSIDLNRVAQLLGAVVEGTTAAGGQVLIILVVMFFLAIDSTSVRSRWALIRASHPELAASMLHFFAGVRKYWVVATVFGLIVAVLDVIALLIIGVPLVFVWGVLAFVTNYIPNVGFVLGLIPPALIALLDGGVTDMIWVIVAYTVLNFTVQTIIQPKVTGDAVGLSPAVSFLSLTFWTLVVGPLGAILAVPLSLAAKAALVDAHPSARWINAFLVTDSEAKKARHTLTGKHPRASIRTPRPPGRSTRTGAKST